MFDAAREPLAPQGSGWVFRSDAAAAPAVEPPLVAPATPPEATPVAAQPARPAAAPRPTSPAPRQAPPAAPARGLRTITVDRLISPVALALTIALAPLGCFSGSRQRR